MGKLIAEKLMTDGHEVYVWNRSKDMLDSYKIEKSEYIVKGKLKFVRSIEDYRQELGGPRVLWTMLSAGEATNSILEELLQIVDAGDVVIDGGNSHFKDTEKWAEEFKKKNVKFLGIGVSGGVHALENGCSLMAGGDKDGFDFIRQILDSLAKPNGGYAYFGAGGSGHFVKMVHNGIEYGMMQALGEGFGVLAKSDYAFNLLDVVKTWQHGSIVSSFLLNMAGDALTREQPSVTELDGYIGANGEGKWTVEQAKELNVPVPVIEGAVNFRSRSEYDRGVRETFAAKLVSAMRHEFGGHATEAPKAETPPTQTS